MTYYEVVINVMWQNLQEEMSHTEMSLGKFEDYELAKKALNKMQVSNQSKLAIVGYIKEIDE